MHSRGYQYETQGHWILRFDRFLQANPELAGSSLETMLACWKAAKPTRNHAAECQKLGRLLTKARHRLDPGIPPKRFDARPERERSEEHTTEIQSLMRISYGVFCLKKKKQSQSLNASITIK